MQRITPRKGDAPSLYTKVGRVSRVRTFLNFCVNKGFMATSPLKIDVTSLVEKATREKRRPKVYSAEQCIALFNAALDYDPRYLPFVVLSTWCFMRGAEARRVQKDHIHLDEKRPCVEVWPRKHGTVSHRTVNIPAALVPILRECMADSRIWPDGTTPHYDETSWKTVRAEAGLVTLGERDAKSGFRKILSSDWEENVLRHTGISMLFRSLSDEADDGNFSEDSVIASVTRQAGNSDETAFRHYVFLTKSGEAQKFFGFAPRSLKDSAALKNELAQSSAQAVA